MHHSESLEMKILAILRTGLYRLYTLIKTKTTVVWPNTEKGNIVYYLFIDLKLLDLLNNSSFKTMIVGRHM